MKPICEYCHNKVSDNTYIWCESDQKLVHKVCKIVSDEMRKDVVVQVDPMKLTTKVKSL